MGPMPRLRFGEIARRLTSFGITVPTGAGLSVGIAPPAPSDRQHATELLAFLQDRRVLFDPTEVEVPAHCAMSVMEIRHQLARHLAQLDGKSTLAASLRGMLAACHVFQTRTQSVVGVSWRSPGAWDLPTWIFDQALGEWRAILGLHIAQIAAAHELDIEGPLTGLITNVAPDLAIHGGPGQVKVPDSA